MSTQSTPWRLRHYPAPVRPVPSIPASTPSMVEHQAAEGRYVSQLRDRVSELEVHLTRLAQEKSLLEREVLFLRERMRVAGQGEDARADD